MRTFDFFTSRNKIDELKIAMVATYALSKIKDKHLRDRICQKSLLTLCKCGFNYEQAGDTFDNSPGIVQAGLLANAMIDLGIYHGVVGFRWTHIKNPFQLETYLKSDNILRKAAQEIYNDYGLSLEDCIDPNRELF